MADLKLKDFVDESSIKELLELDSTIEHVKATYVSAAKELAKGLKINVEVIGDLDKLNSLVAAQAKKAQEATDLLSESVRKHNDIIEKTTVAITRELSELEKENSKKKEVIQSDQSALNIAREILGSREQNIKRLVELTSELKQVSEEQKKLNEKEKNGLATTEQLSAKRQELIERERTLKTAKSELNIILSNEEKMMQAAAGSYTQVSLQLELMKKAYKQMNEEEKSSSTGQTLAAEIQNTDSYLKDLAANMGEYQRSTGNYAIAGESVKKQLKELVVEIATLTVSYRNMSEEERKSAAGQELEDKIGELTGKASELKDAIGDVNASISAGASDTTAFDAVSEGINLVISGYGAATGAAQLLGLSEEDLVEVQTKLQAAFVISNAIIEAQNILQKQSSLMKGIATVQEKALTVSTNINTAAQGKNIIVTKLAAVAQAAFNLVAKANPYVLLATAIITVVGAFVLFSAGARKAEREQRKLNDELKRTSNDLKRIQDNSDFNVAIAEASGESAKEIRKMRYEALAAANDLAYLQKMSVQAKYMLGDATKEQYEEAIRIEQDTYDNLKKFLDEGVIAEVANQRKRKEEELKAAKDAAKTRLEVIKQLKQSEIDLMDDGLKKEIASIRFSYKQKIDAVTGNSSEEKQLKINLTEQMNKEISKKEFDYQTNREKLLAQIRLDIAEKGSKEEMDAKLHLLDLEMDAEYDAVEKSGINGALICEKYQKRKNEVLQEYAGVNIQLIAESAAHEQQIRDTDYVMEMSAAAERYANELKAGKDSVEAKEKYEKEKYQITLDYTRKTTKAAIDALELELNADNLSAEDRGKIAEQLQKLKVDLAKQEAEAEIDAIEKVTKADEKAKKERIKNVKQWLQTASQVIGSINDLVGAVYDGQIEKIEDEQDLNDEKYESDIERVENLAETGAITEEEAEARKRAAKIQTEAKNRELEKQKAEMQQKQAKWEKANAISQSIIGTALAIMNALQTQPFPVGLAFAAIAGVMGAIQLATIVAQPIPSYAEGTKDSVGHRGGTALVGDAGRREVILHNGLAWITPDTPTLMDIPKGAQVFPDVDELDMTNLDILNWGIPTFSPSNVSAAKNNTIVVNDYSRLEKRMDKTNSLLQKSIKQQREDASNREFENYTRRKLS